MKSGVTVKCATRSDNILIGNMGLQSSQKNGYLLEPGESIFLEVNNLNKIWVVLQGNAGNASVYYIGT